MPSLARADTPDGDVRAWRDDGLRALLTVASIVTPIAATLAILLRPPPHSLLDMLVLAATALAMPILRFAPVLSVAVRAMLTMAALFGVGIFILARSGLTPGVALLFAVTSILGALYFGRGVAFGAVALGGLAFVVVGWCVSTGRLSQPPTVVDAARFENWVRVGTIFGLITTLLTSAITFVIGRVEANARALRVAYERLGHLHRRLEQAKEEERRFLAHELHDELGQNLTGLKLQLQLQSRAGGAPPAGPGALDALTMIDALIARVRRMSGDLRPPLLDEVGLVPALRAFVAAQADLSGVQMTLEANEGSQRLGPAIEITCFRIVQEAVTNALRHADARALRVELDHFADHVSLRVGDDGRGFDMHQRLDAAATAGHLGVVGMRERVRAHGGAFTLRSQPGSGTTIAVELPVG